MHHTQENIIFNSIHSIFDEGLFSKYTNFHVKEHKLYDELLNKTSLETESLVPNSSEKDGPAPVPMSPIQNNTPTCSSSPSLFYKSTSSLSTPESKKPTVKIEEINYVDYDVEIQPSSPQ